ncbi:MAG: helix-turn-helix transcriptional regulator [Sphingomonadaceae bacterium]
MNAAEFATRTGSDLWRASSPLRERRFGDQTAESVSRGLVAETMIFLETLVEAKASVFLWLGSDCEIVEAQMRNIDAGMVARYEAGLGAEDPLHARRIKRTRRTIALMSANETHVQPGYRAYFESIGFGDELALMLWRRDRPFACLSLCRGINDPPFSISAYNWDALLRYIETSLSWHSRFRYDHVEHSLAARFQLKPREIDVVELILQGKSNADISEILDISLATVKVHVGRILGKMGVDSRLALACLVSHLPAHAV